MDVAGLNVRIMIQKSVTETDRYGNYTSSWSDYFPCWATAVTNGRDADETEEAGHTQEADRLDITVKVYSISVKRWMMQSKLVRLSYQNGINLTFLILMSSGYSHQ